MTNKRKRTMTPLSEEQLAEWNEKLVQTAMVLTGTLHSSPQFLAKETDRAARRYMEQLPALLAEVEAWREIGRKLDRIDRSATGEVITISHGFIMDCPLCRSRIIGPSVIRQDHRPDCAVLKARALLGISIEPS